MNVTAAVHSLYSKLPANGKPKKEGGEFTVLAAIVAVQDSKDAVVLSLATGTKCAGVGVIQGENCAEGAIVSDSHAEVLARRGLMRYLCKSILGELWGFHLSENSVSILEFSADLQKFRIKSNVKLFLYISDNPCGDACIYHQQSMKAFTGAKPVVSSTNGIVHNGDVEWAREDVQTLGAVRTKSGRSDLPTMHRTTSMSCSDKICRWKHLGLQGSFLSVFLERVPLSGVMVDPDPMALTHEQLGALQRALGRPRLTSDPPVEQSQLQLISLNSALKIEVCTGSVFSAGKRFMEHLHASQAASNETSIGGPAQPLKKVRPVGTSINWIRDVEMGSLASNGSCDDVESRRRSCRRVASGTCEVTLSHTGALQGAIKACIGSTESASRLSKREMGRLLGELLAQPRLYDMCTIPTLGGDSGQYPEKVEISAPATQLLNSALSKTYRWWKQADKEYMSRRCAFLESSVFKDWICDDAPDFIVGETATSIYSAGPSTVSKDSNRSKNEGSKRSAPEMGGDIGLNEDVKKSRAEESEV